MYGPSPGASRRLGARLTLVLALLVAVAAAVMSSARGTTAPATADPLFGVNMSFYGPDDAFVTRPQTRELFRSWGVPIVRVPLRDRFEDGTPVGDDQWLSAMRAVRDIGATPMLIIRGPGHRRTVDDLKQTDLHLLDLIHQVFGDGTAYLEFGSEPDLPGVDVPAADYTVAWNTVVPALKSRYPKAKYRYVGPASWRVDHDYVKYLGAFVAGATPEPDFLSWHEYVCGTTGGSDWKQTCESHLANWQTHVTDVEMTVQGEIGRQLPYFISEWNADSDAKGSVYTEANAGYLASWTTTAIERLRALRPAPSGAMIYTATDHRGFGLVTGADQVTAQGRAFQAAMTGSATVTQPKTDSPSQPASPIPATGPASGTTPGTDSSPGTDSPSSSDSSSGADSSPGTDPSSGADSSSGHDSSSGDASPPASPPTGTPSPDSESSSATPGGPGATGNRYYVTPGGDDAKGDGTSAHPWATIQHAADTLTVGNAGATVHVADGTYAESVSTTKSGHAGGYLTFEAEHPGKAVIAPKTSKFPFESKGDYVRITGFDISGAGGAWSGILLWGHHNVVQGNHVHDVLTHLAPKDCDGSPGGQAIGDDASASDNAFLGNRVDHIGPYPTACEYVHGIYPSGGADLIQNNIVSQTSGSGIRFNHNAKGATIANNLSFANANHGIYITGGDSTADHFVITNNIVRDNAMYGINVRSDANGPHNQYRNNLFFDNHKGGYGLDNSEEFTPPNTSGTLDADPRLVRYATDGTGDYHLTADSPCVDAGTTTGAPSDDLDGVERPAGRGVDIGPYEFTR
ncbi:choice-of-anchor Q domain-containing protein [Actinoallomurus soli]|uniref:choice-of-anchor Q domain-containing protein n=1 Tax=Actinoallomurus soli TaxID=2952535 RepID=UPI002092513B|nr:choice-of-anchor Q domain-containing protein [Actinoallomurus soli]MCO5967423.1 right-handed parallel beta-helix repeat-containing protein [Actinoallomurus soli]